MKQPVPWLQLQAVAVTAGQGASRTDGGLLWFLVMKGRVLVKYSDTAKILVPGLCSQGGPGMSASGLPRAQPSLTGTQIHVRAGAHPSLAGLYVNGIAPHLPVLNTCVRGLLGLSCLCSVQLWVDAHPARVVWCPPGSPQSSSLRGLCGGHTCWGPSGSGLQADAVTSPVSFSGGS